MSWVYLFFHHTHTHTHTHTHHWIWWQSGLTHKVALWGWVPPFKALYLCAQGFPWWLRGKESARNAGDKGDAGLIPRSGKSPREGNDNSLQYSCLENFMDRGAWWSTFQRVPFSSFLNYSCIQNVTLSSLRMTLFHLSSYLFPANTSLGKKVM